MTKKTVHVVGAVIEREDGAILAALRSPTMSLPNLWEFPGGKIEENETHATALTREIAEELGCTIAVGELVADVFHEYDAVIVHLITYKATVVSGTPIACEHAELRWLTRAELAMVTWAPADIPSIERLQEEIRA